MIFKSNNLICTCLMLSLVVASGCATTPTNQADASANQSTSSELSTEQESATTPSATEDAEKTEAVAAESSSGNAARGPNPMTLVYVVIGVVFFLIGYSG
jgi:ABC-type Na+ efflux pump permease subunit